MTLPSRTPQSPVRRPGGVPLLLLCLALLLGAPKAARAGGLQDAADGVLAFGEGRIEQAVELFTSAIQSGNLAPEALSIALSNRGVAWDHLGDFDRAIADYEAALAIAPADAAVRADLAASHLRRGDANILLGEEAAAEADYAAAIELDPDNPLAYDRRARLLLAKGDAAGAVADLRIALEQDPSREDLAAILGEIESRLPQESAADPAASGAPAADPGAAASEEPPPP
jgi:tetratricopeptide (TPR) repeat protein